MVASSLFSSDRWSDVMSVLSVATLLSAGCSCLTRWWPGGDQGRLPREEAAPTFLRDGAQWCGHVEDGGQFWFLETDHVACISGTCMLHVVTPQADAMRARKDFYMPRNRNSAHPALQYSTR